MKIEVKKNAKRNILVGSLNKVVMLIFPFIIRSIINVYLGAEFLGLNSLFSSILAVLSLSELGFGSAMVFHMYKPIAEDDQATINALLNLYKRVYSIIGIAITIIGCILLPFLRFLIRGNTPVGINIYIIFLIELFNSSISYYLFGYRQSLLVAYQREDINSIANLISQTLLKLSQIILLIFTRNYYLYALCSPCFSVLNNILILYFTKKIFPFVKCEGQVEESILQSIKKLVAGAFVQKACDATRNSLDSICISSFIGLALTAIYNNYYTIFSSINIFLTVIIGSISAGIGHHIITKEVSENFDEMKKIDFLYLNLHGFCTVCLLCLIQPFMKIWMGDTMILPFSTVVLFALYFYVGGIGKIRAVYYSAKGLWWEMRYRSFGEMIANIVLNIALGYFFGLNGIIVATIISLLTVNFIWGNIILFKNYFGIKRLKDYYLYQIKYFVVSLCVSLFVFLITARIKVDNVYLEIFLKGIVCSAVGFLCYYLIYRKTQICKQSVRLVQKTK